MKNKQMHIKDDMTLEEGLKAFHQKNAKYFANREYSTEGEAFMKCHDIAHVVFGCDTTIYGEGLVKIWTTFGTTSTFWEVTRGYKEANAFDLFRRYSFGHVMKNIFRFLRTLPKAISSARKMSKPWPFKDYQAYLQMPIGEIRKSFHIEVVH